MRWEPSPDDDQVKRRIRFEAANPGWSFISPKDPRSILRGETYWRAVAPDGSVTRGLGLRDLLNRIEKLT